MSKLIYLDNAATTKTAPEVLDAMLPYFSEYYGNPSSIYDFAQKSKEAVTKGRQQIADALNTRKEDIYFTAGGSEADNWALKATFEAYKSKGNHIITTKIEHHAILHTCEYHGRNHKTLSKKDLLQFKDLCVMAFYGSIDRGCCRGI